MLDARVLVVTSGSMAPAIDVGSAVLVRGVAADQVAVGDVVSVVDDGERVMHRVVAVHPSGTGEVDYDLVLKGDANEAADPTRYDAAVVDRELVAVPGLGYAIAAMATPLGLFTLIGVVLVAAWAARSRPESQSAPRHRDVPASSGAQVRRIVGTAFLLAGLAIPFAVPRLAGTAAAFTDDASAASGALATLTLTPPDTVSCSGGGAISTQITLSWPHKDIAYDYQVVIRDAGGTVRQTYLVTGAGAVGSTQSRVIPGGLLGSIGLGTFYTTAEVRSQLKTNAAWQSAAMRTWTYREVVVVLGLSIHCS
ncbi:signal peptidase I [Nocardioides sp. Bht2]|uniref:signal peptidase I n=1 Tax=Nocardioides sp. Bht2 TaxID=3392297 RepID=UPI0039B41EA8